MKRRMRLIVTAVMLSTLASAVFAQRGFRRGYLPAPDQPLAGEPKEWTFARLAYDGGRFGGRGGWATDYPRAEYHFSQAVERLTRIDVHPEGHVVSPNSDEVFNYPWLYAVEVGSWAFSDPQASRMREYLLRGGFLMVDDFHGSVAWQVFQLGLKQIFPDREVEEIPSSDPIFHVIYDLENRSQIPGLQYVYSGSMYERDGVDPHWRCVRDDNGRIMIAISFNQDVGDAWEWADDPAYPQPWAFQAYQIGIDYILYAMTH